MGRCVPSLKIEKKVLTMAKRPVKGAKSVSVKSENNSQLLDEVEENIVICQ